MPEDRVTRYILFSAKSDTGGSTLSTGLMWLHVEPHHSVDCRNAPVARASYCVTALQDSCSWVPPLRSLALAHVSGRQRHSLFSRMPEGMDQWTPGGMCCAAAKMRPVLRGQKQPFEVSIDVMLRIVSHTGEFSARGHKETQGLLQKHDL